jgi:polar amino acid transport system substrate-binding protein
MRIFRRAMLMIGMTALMASSLAAQETLKTAVDGTFAPHAMPKMSGGIEGFNVDLNDAIAAKLKKKITLDAVQFSGLIPALQAGTYDFLVARREPVVYRGLSQHRFPVPFEKGHTGLQIA